MADEPAIVDPIRAGCAAGRDAWSADVAEGVAPPARAVLLMRGAIECAALVEQLPGPPLHDAAVARERFVWAFVLGYTEGTTAEDAQSGERARSLAVQRQARRVRRSRSARQTASSKPARRPRRRRALPPRPPVADRYSPRTPPAPRPSAQ